MLACKELFERDEIAQALSHLLPIDSNHVIVHPIAYHLVALTGYSLRYLTFVMWEDKVHSPTMNIEMIAQIFTSHGGTLTVPAREAIAPRTGPTHDMFGHGTLPKGKVYLVALLAYTIQLTTVIDDIVQVSPRENAIVMIFVIFLNIKINRTVALVSITIGKNLFYQFLLLYDVTCGMRLDAWRQHV